MTDLIVALGLVLAIEGIFFAAFPSAARRAMEMVAATPEAALRRTGVITAIVGVGIVWLIRG